ncbi:MAG TPA: 16S rRNA (guanine(527)-N(7))-methyltransferase RsmG, partial [Sediminispirochaeta sp.]|nr:16S rRNA (guanine(527)-N(7))-methyltransferase RsmG [Sediminispirochaeta sp.]
MSDTSMNDPEAMLRRGLLQLKLYREGGGKVYETVELERFVSSARLFLDELERWNRRISLISGDRRDIILRHLLDSLSVYPHLRSLGAHRIADVGSGNGFPALALALLDRKLRIDLVERSSRKAAYLRDMVGRLGLGGELRVLEEDLQQVSLRYPLVISRALMPLHRAVPLMRRLLEPGGTIYIFAGRKEKLEWELQNLNLPRKEEQVEILSLAVPFLDEERNLC